MVSIIKSPIQSVMLQFNMTTGSAVARYAPATTSNLGTQEKAYSTITELAGKEILGAVGVEAVKDSGVNRAYLETGKTTVRIWGLPNQTYSCRVVFFYR